MAINRLFIAEKPALGTVIAEALGNPVRKDGYFQCGTDAVTWCVGHVLELAPPEVHNPSYAKWNMADLPMNIRPHKYQPKPNTEKQFNVIKNLISQSQILVNAGDPDDEGQLLVDEVIEFCNARQPVKRVLINDLNVSAAKKALSNLKDNSEFRGLSQKALARSVGDQLYGFNMTRAYTLAAQAKGGGKQVLSVGRVQTPILGLIVARYLANKDHKASYFYNINGQFDFAGAKIKARYTPSESAPVDDKNRITDEAFANSIISDCKGKVASISSHSVEDKRALAPLPFALLDLQAAMSKKHGLGAQATLDITQSLREKHKAITYNRSDCNYLSSEQFSEAPQTLAMLANIFPNLSSLKINNTQKGRAFNDANVSAHTAIIPTTTQPNLSAMTADEKKVYQAIVDQYVAQFLPDRTYKQCRAEFTVIGHTFATTATQTTDQGWAALLGSSSDDEGDDEAQAEETPYNALAALQGGQNGACETVTAAKEKTKPLPLYTEATLLKDLQRVAKYVKDPRIKQLLKDKDAGKKGESGGIGTPATRAAMLETLKKRGFYIEKGKKLEPTPLGIEFIAALPEIATTPDMTALWHEQQTAIERGEMTVDQFLDALDEFIAGQISGIDVNGLNVPSPTAAGQHARLESVCPDCSGELVNTAKAIHCRGCQFRLFKTICGKNLTDNQISTLFKNKKTAVIKGFTSKQGKKFEAALKLEQGGKIAFDFGK